MTVINKNHHNTYEHFLTENECELVRVTALANEEQILNIPNPVYRRNPTGYTGLTAQHTVYNWLSNDTIKGLNIPQRLFDLPDFEDTTTIAIQCWMNILRQQERLETHSHGEEHDGFYALNIFISGNTTTGTHYEDIGYRPNNIGEITIASNFLEHGVPSHLFREPRISMAMDIWLDEYPDELENAENRILTFHRPHYDVKKL